MEALKIDAQHFTQTVQAMGLSQTDICKIDLPSIFTTPRSQTARAVSAITWDDGETEGQAFCGFAPWSDRNLEANIRMPPYPYDMPTVQYMDLLDKHYSVTNIKMNGPREVTGKKRAGCK